MLEFVVKPLCGVAILIVGATVSSVKERSDNAEVLSAFRTVADTLVSLDEDANTLVQTQRAQVAARDAQGETESRYKLGATPFFATLTAGQQYESARIQDTRARASRLADTAALFDSMGSPPADVK